MFETLKPRERPSVEGAKKTMKGEETYGNCGWREIWKGVVKGVESRRDRKRGWKKMERVVDGKRGVYRVPTLGERGIRSVTARHRKSGQRNNLHDCVNNSDDRGNRESGVAEVFPLKGRRFILLNVKFHAATPLRAFGI